MSTNNSTPTTPKNPARGSQQGQTTLAAKIDRWEAMSNNLLPMLGDMPQLKQVHADLQQAIAEAKGLRDHLKAMKGEAQSASAQRKQLVAKGESLFSLLSFGLRFAFGPTNQRLNTFGVRPLRNTGRPAKTPGQAPAPEAPATPSAQPSPTQK